MNSKYDSMGNGMNNNKSNGMNNNKSNGLNNNKPNGFNANASNGMNNNNNKPGTSKFQLKVKPSSMSFNLKRSDDQSSPKRIKLDANEEKPSTITSYSHLNGNINGAKPNGAKTQRPKLSIHDQRRNLPIFSNRNKLLDLINSHETLILVGETGCGKTTQVPQYIHSARFEKNGCIAITQPRRVAAISIAKRVALEHGGGMDLGDVVGYTVRFEDVTSKKTKIKFLTDGMLLREAMFDKLLMNYTVIILDEAHERTIHTDILFGVVKAAQKKRKDKNISPLKIIVMSATMDVDHFSSYFNNCQGVYLEGRTFPVNMFYARKPQDDYQTACVSTFFKIHREAPPDHDVLIFLTGQEEIEAVAHQIRLLSKDSDVEGPPLKVLTLYAAQPSAQQLSVFQPVPDGNRKVIISTNIAETSLTISGIRYVIDSGMVKLRSFHPSTGLEMLKVERISQEQAWQRTGRAGRESEGYCYRLYTRSQFELMPKSSVPEIQRANLSTVVLQLLSLGIHPDHFDFMSPPSKEALAAAFEQLRMLGAIEDIEHAKLTDLGKTMKKFPLDPRFSKVLLTAQQYGCVEEALVVVSFLSGESVLLNPSNRKEQAQAIRRRFCTGLGDHITLLNIYREFAKVGKIKKRAWCHEHFINFKNILTVRDIRSQLENICTDCGITISSCGSRLDMLRKCLLAGLFMNVAELSKDRQYVALHKKQTVFIHPSSDFHGQQPYYVLFTEIVQTTKCYIRQLSLVDSDWFLEVAPDYFKHVKLRTN